MLKHAQHRQVPGGWRNRWLSAGFGTCLTLRAIAGQDTGDTPDKAGYNLFNPTPRELLRELSTDRPDQTESPYTLDAGHFQMELDLINAVFDHDKGGGNDVKTRGWTAGGINLKVGLLNNVDIQFVYDTWVKARVKDRAAGTVNWDSGAGDLQTRLKINLWGNDGGPTAFGIMPFVKWPLPESDVRNGETEGGLIIPFAADLGGGWGLGAMTEFDYVSDENGGHDTAYFNTITVGHDLVGALAGYLEFAALVMPESDDDWLGLLGAGFTFGINENAQLDFGCNFGVTESAPDYNPFIGITLRF